MWCCHALPRVDPGSPAGTFGRVPAAALPDAPAGPSRIPREIWVLIAAAFVIALGYGLISPVLPRFAKSFDVSVTATTFIFSAFALCRLVFAPAGGSLVTRFGERPVYLLGLAIVTVSTALSAVAGSYWQLLGFRSFGGIGSTLFTVSAIGLIVRLSPPDIRGRVSSAYASAWLFGGISGPLLGGQLARFGLRAPFLVYAVMLLIAMLVVAMLLPASSLRPAEGVRALVPMPLREALRDSAYRAGLVSGFANGWSNFGVRIALVPLFVTAILHGTDSDTGNAIAIFGVGNGLFLFGSGRLADRLGRRPLIISGLVVSGVLTVAVAWVASVPGFYLVSFVAGAGVGLFNPAQQAVVADVVGPHRGAGQVVPPYQMAGDFGAIIGPLVAGRIVDSSSYETAFAVSGLIVIAGAIPWWFARETLVSRARPPREPLGLGVSDELR